MAQTYFMLVKRRQQSRRMVMRRKRRQADRQIAFARKQARERFGFMFMLSVATSCVQLYSEKTVWTKPRSRDWWDNVVNSSFLAEDWIANFRMSQSTFLYICNKLMPSIARVDTIMRKAISHQHRLAIALWYLSTGADYRTIAHLFGVSKPTVCVVVKEVSYAIVCILLPDYIKIPVGDSLREIVHGFKLNHGFPQCAGVVDGCHIPIISPSVYPADFYNRKGWHSIILQGTVDHQGRFIDVNIGWPGRVHDARVFSNSSLYKKGQSNSLLPDWKENISGRDVPLIILGDPAYPLLPWLMKAFPNNGNLSQQQKKYNYSLSKARVVVEYTYGRLKGRWRCLLKRLDVNVVDVPVVVAACCALHNICEVLGEAFEEEWLEGVVDDRNSRSSLGVSSTQEVESAVNIRTALMAYFNHQ